MNKRTRCAERIHQKIYLLKCPICGKSLRVVEQKSLICAQKHTFDLAKQGYVNLSTKQVHTHYGKTLFEARRKIIVDHGFFNPLIHILSEQIGKQLNLPTDISILDLGCGEGSHLAKICQMLIHDASRSVTGCGIDIAKEGIQLASKYYPEQIWLVGDLAQPPFKERQFNLILNILSPSNYQTFDQMVKPGGYVIKVIPGSGYLKELRSSIYEHDKAQYSNADTRTLFTEHFPDTITQNIHYVAHLNREGIRDLIRMTPLAWNVSEEKRTQWLEKESADITCEFELLIGKG
ncbi:putative RNA methyltransferase [Sporolactobacillus nakayamae]|uniref:23S rRNA (Guanine745-N1)-methyltransferase n=1 Tax=Sporolactobacillus nakayamae TaxID=269670 RepID=A0A1I2N6B3_9BACL|nr:methyltransferase domain-containing protein [Sporolactobacillus nakayamae]SFF99312.1 23S rRNA (guanine745-N1)-methyltransferase [Sporolactobacillus nakayamae]